jgi:hypothetical protein
VAVKRGTHKREITDLNFKMNEVAEKGLMVTYDVTNAGHVRLETSISGVVTNKVAGLLLTSVVNKDFNAIPVNRQLIETGLSGFVLLMKEGEIATDLVDSGALDASGVPLFGPGSGVFLADSGRISNVQFTAPGGSGNPRIVVDGNERVGTAIASPDANNFVKLYLDIN